VLPFWASEPKSIDRPIALAARFFSGQNRIQFKTVKFFLEAVADNKNVEISSEECRHLILHEMPYQP